MKHLKAVTAILAAIIVALVGCLGFVLDQRAKAIDNHNDALADYKEYSEKRDECTGHTSTTSSIVNSAGLTDCGVDLAIDNKLTFTSLYNIYHNYCYSGFGAMVYGCYQPDANKIYVCTPGTTLYDRKWIKLVGYRGSYSTQLAAYSSNQQNGELFVRVGADGRQVDDIELIELYSKVSSTYVAKKQNYYNNLMATTNRYINEYNELSRYYTIMMAILIALISASAIALIAVAIVGNSRKKATVIGGQKSILDIQKEKRLQKARVEKSMSVLYANRASKPKKYSIFDMNIDKTEDQGDDEEFEELRMKINDMGKKENKAKTTDNKTEQEKFKEFKKSYGIFDDEDDDDYLL